jgi:hypothetical protein
MYLELHFQEETNVKSNEVFEITNPYSNFKSPRYI